MVRVAVDAMGGDRAPEINIDGALLALEKFPDLQVILCGPKALIESKLRGRKYDQSRLEIDDAPELVGMDEHPGKIVRNKPNSGVVRSAVLVRQQQADAALSAGNTGAAMAAALFKIGRISGVERPAIGVPLPVGRKFALLVDAGANADCRPNQLMQFAKMGSIYANQVLKVANPKVGLLNIGEEPEKGNELAKEAHNLLSSANNLNFIGNIEGRDIPAGTADVIVCDGFVGNIVLKLVEGMWKQFGQMLKEQIFTGFAGKCAGLTVKGRLDALKKGLDVSEIGGAVLLGIDGVYIISHGSSDAKAIMNAIRVAKESVQIGLIDRLKQNITL